MSKMNVLKVKNRLKRMGMKAVPSATVEKIAEVSERIGIVKAIGTAIKSMKACTKIYNEACGICQQKLIRDPNMAEEEYCKECKPLVRKHLGGMAE